MLGTDGEGKLGTGWAMREWGDGWGDGKGGEQRRWG